MTRILKLIRWKFLSWSNTKFSLLIYKEVCSNRGESTIRSWNLRVKDHNRLQSVTSTSTHSSVPCVPLICSWYIWDTAIVKSSWIFFFFGVGGVGWSVHLLTSQSGRHPAIVTFLFLCVKVELFHPCGFDWITQELLISKLSVLLLEYQLHINLFFILKKDTSS